MRMLLALLLLAGAPFWEAKPPAEWTDQELAWLLESSPWVKTLAPRVSIENLSGLKAHLATARPMRDAEQEYQRRLAKRRPADAPEDMEFEEFLAQNEGRYIVLAIRLPNPKAFGNAKEIARMEEQSFLQVERERYKMAGHLPPSGSDPLLRLVFPRPSVSAAGSLAFDVYVPSAPSPYRAMEFWVKDLAYKGKPEM